ncbi:unnamed protein product [Rotaria magnacalcarata]|uniref:CSD domain-containing protein n=2 Tax=Rotaria magnacalcarata TaxID=392030 RepID=A0A816W671_9BILA|nr:unnamed protein product [Rotaria magnacalcarata]CAF3846608.1 unnamed protein product [Rotaria magnacalcarata]
MRTAQYKGRETNNKLFAEMENKNDVRLCGVDRVVTYKDSNWANEFHSRVSGKPSIKIKSIHIHHTSDIFDPHEDYVGLIVYLCDEKNDFILNNVHSQTGDIYIRRSSWIFGNTPEGRDHKDSVHGRLFYSIFRCWIKKELNFVGAGFSYYNGIWKFNSGTLNTMNQDNNDDTYHNTDRKLSISEERIIRTMNRYFYINHEWLAMSPEERIPFHALKQLGLTEEKSRMSGRVNDISEVNPDRRLRGKVIWFDAQKGYGFIDVTGFQVDIFVHWTVIDDMPRRRAFLKHDEDVEFHVVQSDRGWQTRELTRLKS